MFIIGLQFVVELLHPEMKELPRYQCNLCKSNCAQTNILTHIWGRGHRIAYLVSSVTCVRVTMPRLIY